MRVLSSKSQSYPDIQAAAELKRELVRAGASFNKESFVYTGLNFAVYLAERLGQWDFAKEIKSVRAKILELFSKSDKTEDEKDELERLSKLAMYALIRTFWDGEHAGCALVLENEAVRHWGELDEHRKKKSSRPRSRLKSLEH